MRTLVFGSLNIDYVYQMDHIVRPGETESSVRMEKHAGGKGLNQAVALAKAGAETYFAGCIGTDGAFLKEVLERYGVRTQHLIRREMANGNAIIQVDARGQNSIVLYGGSNQAVTPEQIDETLAAFGKGDLLLMQNEISGGRYLMEKAHEKGMTVAVNPSPISEELMTWPLDLAEYLILNETEGEALTGTPDVARMITVFQKRFPRTNVVLTLGGKGAYSIENGSAVFGKAYRVPVVDTTAAGDTFTGFYLMERSRGGDPLTCLRQAACASAIAIGIPGAAESIPDLARVRRELPTMDHEAVD